MQSHRPPGRIAATRPPELSYQGTCLMIPHVRRLRVWLIVAICSLPCTIYAAEPSPPAVRSPLSPQEALQQLVLPPGLKAEIVACEPELVDPVAMRFDEQGRLWVAEMRDYPDPPAPGELPKSQIKLLEDRDGDGRFETMHLFADHLLFATGLQPWQGGVLATISGQIVFLKDTDGDNKADVQQPWFTGFAEKNPQLRVNHPRFALDNRIYAAGGLQGGDVLSSLHPQARPSRLRNKDIRFDPRTETAEAIAGNGQFAMAFDDFGRRFLCNNRHPLMHVVLEDRYLDAQSVAGRAGRDSRRGRRRRTVSHLPASASNGPLRICTPGSSRPPAEPISTAAIVAGRIPRQCLQLRADRQPGASRSAAAAGRHVHFLIALRSQRIPGHARYLVSAGGHRERPGRGACTSSTSTGP